MTVWLKAPRFFMKQLKESLPAILGIGGFVAICYVAYIYGEMVRKFPLTTPIILIILCAVSIVIVFHPAFNKMRKGTKTTILFASLVVAAFAASTFLSEENFHTEPLICSIFLNGHIEKYEVEGESDEGVEYTDTRYQFVPASKADDTAKNLIDLGLLIISVSSILFPLFLLNNKLDFSFKNGGKK